MTPAITILMPACNAGKYIAAAIHSVLSQTFTDFELLIINDGSTDNTWEEIQKFEDSRIRLFSQSNKGVIASLNKGLELAQGKYIARFDADDICYPHRLSLQYDFLEKNPDHVLIGSAADYIDKDGHFLFRWQPPAYDDNEIQETILYSSVFDHPAVMYKKQTALELGGYPQGAIHFEDHLFWTSFFSKGKTANLPDALIFHRFNPGSATIDEKWRGSFYKQIKYRSIRNGYINETDKTALEILVKKQDSYKLKTAAYHALCGKKFLVNNYQPGKARNNFARSIRFYPYRADNYAFYLLSFLPKPFLDWLYKRTR